MSIKAVILSGLSVLLLAAPSTATTAGFALGSIPATLASELPGYPVTTATVTTAAPATANGANLNATAAAAGFVTALFGTSAAQNQADLTAIAGLTNGAQASASSSVPHYSWGAGGTATSPTAGGTPAGSYDMDKGASNGAPERVGLITAGFASSVAFGTLIFIMRVR